ncbi:hypothetical protein [Enterobacter kobei]|uniref:hypothetical protein n=1 Tax=Enterobacter kobei TaxID=208224 RepID=UPI003A96EFCA
MKKTGVVVGMLTALLFSAGVMAANDPQSGRFSFLARTPEPVDHFFTLRIQAVGRMPNTGDGNQALGVNVYWKTKDKNELQGRSIYNSLQPNLPRPGANFSDTYYAGKTRYKYEGNHENIEWLVWENFLSNGSMDYDFNNGCAPTLGNTFTRFYNHRFSSYIINPKHSSAATCFDQAVITQPRGEDLNVALTSFAVTHNTEICNRMGAFCIGAKIGSSGTLTKDIYIPSINLEYLVIEVFGFEYNTEGGRKSESFYILAVEALKFTANEQAGKMNLLRGDRDAGGEFSAFGVSGYSQNATGDIRGYYNAQDSHYYLNEERTAACGKYSTDPCTYDFTKLDTLVLNLQYTDPDKIPKWEHPFSRGIIFTMEPRLFTWHCLEDRSQCNFPPRK